ncbi:MAG TPA: hypothetical protein VES20_13535 [Bryobacteraceae bacterium]|nr:hypothetical protein [Bryobacteraceae bacterium]
MSFLDNLESNLKNLEGVAEKDTVFDRQRREAERSSARAVAPWAETLKKSPFVNEFLTHAVRIGHGSRTRINMNWFGSTLRVEARDRRLELVPGTDGIQAVFTQAGEDRGTEAIDLQGNPEDLARRWLSGLSTPVAD